MFEKFKAAMQKKFAFYGFTAFPFNDAQFKSFYLVCGPDEEKAYSVGCDLAGGFGFTDAMRAIL